MDETLQRDLIWMTLLIFLPAVFGLVTLFIPRGKEDYMRWWALLGSATALGLSLAVLSLYDAQVLERLGVKQDRSFRQRAALPYRVAQVDLESSPLVEGGDPATNPARSDDWIARVPWIAKFNVYYLVGLDGINLALVLLTTTVFFLAMLASWGITKFLRGYLALMLLLETGLLGTYLALDGFLFYVFLEMVLLPLYFLIGIWGGPERVAAAFRYALSMLVGSVLILLALLGLYFTNVRDFVHPDRVEMEARRLADANPAFESMAVKLRQAREQVVVNTFDLLTLQRAGHAALQRLRGEPVTDVPALVVREERLELARKDRPGAVASLEEDLESARAGLESRLAGEPFFQGWGQTTLFVLLFIGFALHLPLVPLHTWWPAVQAETPTPVSMVLTSAVLALGGYGLLRIVYPICPWPAERAASWIALLGVINIVYGALVALAQEDLKKLLAYWSIHQMGFVLLGLSVWTSAADASYWSWGANGALFLLVAHGITSAGLVYLAGMIAERVKHRRLELMGGLAEPMPITAGIGAVLFFAALGIPGLCGFVGQFMVLVGAWNYCGILSIVAILTTLLTAGTLVWTVQRIFLGTNTRFKDAADASPQELLIGALFAGLCLLLGVWPMVVLAWTEPTVTGLIDTLVRLPG